MNAKKRNGAQETSSSTKMFVNAFASKKNAQTGRFGIKKIVNALENGDLNLIYD